MAGAESGDKPTEKKKQHFVPQLYLKNFSYELDQKTIGIYVIKSGTFVSRVPLRDQAYEYYFYGKDGRFEDALSKLEGPAAAEIAKVINEDAPPGRLTQGMATLLSFTILLHDRTEVAANQKNEILDGIIKQTFKNDPRLKGDLEKIRLELSEPGAFSLAQGAQSLPSAFDLHLKLLVNTTSVPFISSDNPVVYYNRFMEVRPHFGSSVGTASKGLQVFVPISPRHCLLFYDSEVYRVGSKRRMSIQVVDDREIRHLNLLQAIHAGECHVFNQSVERSILYGLHRDAARHRARRKIRVERVEMGEKHGKRHALVMSYMPETRVNLQLSFVRIRKKARRFDARGRAAIPRDKSYGPLLADFWEKVREGKEDPANLFPYLEAKLKKELGE